MGKYRQDELDQLIDRAADRAAERAAGVYYEKFKHDIGLVLEATGFIKERLQDMITRDEFNELKSEVKVIRYALKDTNRDLRNWKDKWES
ncbi:MAG TPA: hypothetical protein VHA37_00195 [Candidatus Saccharimonadales bacterium]|nr:hypothetical protein [Candidatus Saccharimonadales bacterium]